MRHILRQELSSQRTVSQFNASTKCFLRAASCGLRRSHIELGNHDGIAKDAPVPYKSRQVPDAKSKVNVISTIPIDASNVSEESDILSTRIQNLRKRMDDIQKKDVFSVTTAAATRLRQLLKEAPHGSNCIRIGVQRKGCSGFSYSMDYDICQTDLDESKSDENRFKGYHRVQKDGVLVLVEEQAIFFLSGTQLDFTTSEVSEKFVFLNPNVKRHCGCGESFLV